MLAVRFIGSRLLLAGALAALFAGAVRAQEGDGVWKGRKSFIPNRKHQPVAGKAVGVLVSDAQPVLGKEGRFGPQDQICFSQDGCSYRWVYVPAVGNPMITNLQVPVLPKGQKRVYPALNMAGPNAILPFGVRKKNCLVEVEVNDGVGSPAGDSFVGTRFTVLDGTKKYPLKVEDVIDRLRKDYAGFCKQKAQDIDAAMARAEKKALNGQKPTGPRQKTELMYVTWMTGDDTLQVRFYTKITDGHYQYVQGGMPVRPFPLPPPPDGKFPPPPGNKLPARPGKQLPPQAPAPAPGVELDLRSVAFPPPPPRDFPVRVGTSYGVDFGRAYIVSKDGKVTGTRWLPFESFQQTMQSPPGEDRPLGNPLPPGVDGLRNPPPRPGLPPAPQPVDR